MQSHERLNWCSTKCDVNVWCIGENVNPPVILCCGRSITGSKKHPRGEPVFGKSGSVVYQNVLMYCGNNGRRR